MFCTHCGKEIFEGEKFCANCGAQIADERRFDTAEFTPSFKKDLATAKARKASEPVKFDWGELSYPEPIGSRKPVVKKEVDFDWSSVLEDRDKQRSVSVEKIKIMPVAPTEPEHEQFAKTTVFPPLDLFDDIDNTDNISEEPTRVMSALKLEDLEEEPIAAPGEFDTFDPRFVTYNEKREEFQKLLDSERMRLEGMKSEVAGQVTMVDTLAGSEDFADFTAELELALKDDEERTAELIAEFAKPEEAETAPELFEAPEEAEDAPELSEEPEAQSILNLEAELDELFAKKDEPEFDFTGRIMSDMDALMGSHSEPISVADELFEEPEEPKTPAVEPKVVAQASDKTFDKTSYEEKLADVFDDEETYVYEKPEKKHKFFNGFAFVLLLVVLGGATFFGIKYFAPEAKIIQKIDGIFQREPKQEVPGPEIKELTESEQHLQQLVYTIANKAKNIGEIDYDSSLKYDISKKYAYSEIPTTKDFEDNDWYESDGKKVTYGERIMSGLLSYYDAWLESNKDPELIGINKLEICDIRSGSEGFYVLCRLSIAKKDGSEVTKLESAYMRISSHSVKVRSTKEEK